MSLTIVHRNGNQSEVSNPGIVVSDGHFVKLEFIYGEKTPIYNQAKRTIYIYPDRIYAIRYYDTECQKLITVRGIVKSIAKDYLILNAIYSDTDKQCDFCQMNQVARTGLLTLKNIIVSYSNITDIVDCQNCIKRGEIVFLGVTAQQTTAIVIKLGILDDEVSTTYVDLKLGGEYNVIYMDGNSICETTGILSAIESIPKTIGQTVSANKGIVRLCGSTQDEFLKCQDKDPDDIIFTFNISASIGRVHSTVFGTEGVYTNVYLSSIRSCKCLRESGVKDKIVTVDGRHYEIVSNDDSITIQDSDNNITATVSYTDIITGLINKPTPL